MQPIQKKQKKSRARLRWLLIPAGLLLLAAVILLIPRNEASPAVQVTSASTYGELTGYDASEVTHVTVTLRSGESWGITRGADGTMSMDGDASFVLDDYMAGLVIDAVRIISYDMILTDDPAEYTGHLADFGLDTPYVTAAVTYADGGSDVIRIGNKCSSEDENWYYMLVDGRDELFALDLSTAEALAVEKRTMHAVTQPVIHKVRIDSITVWQPTGTVAWALDGAITDADAADRWMLTEPVSYPAEGEVMGNIRTNLANLRVGSYICDANAETLTEYGFDTPRMVLTVHMAEGTIGVVSSLGVYGSETYPESTFTLTVGGARSDVVDYVLMNGCIYTISHFIVQAMMDLTPADTVTRYPVRVTLSNLASLTIVKDGATTVYEVERTEQTDEYGTILSDDNGDTLYTYAARRDGKEVAWDAFEPAYMTLVASRVSGTLPSGWTPSGEAHTVFIFRTRTGAEHTIELVPFDAMHDAVICDGGAMFYLIRNGLSFDVTPAEQ